jgi:predicted phosphodiesterase
MKRLAAATVTVALLIAAAGLSGNVPQTSPEFQVERQDRNPWTNLRVNNDPSEFQFVVVSDRTGGHRARIFSRAIDQINLMQPQFVVSVGDLIEGYTEDQAKLAEQWKEFQGYVNKLQMPFFYVPGNHDVSNPTQIKLWQEKFGRWYYHFVYRDVLFLMLDTDDGVTKDHNSGRISDEQKAYAIKTLEENSKVRWTLVFVHRPIWAAPDPDKTGWPDIEKALGSRAYTVFAGHQHHYQKFVRNGRNYYQLATTGGGSRLRGIPYGEFDHIVWVSMKKDGPVLANVLLDGIYPEDMKKPATDEEGSVFTDRRPTVPVHGKLLLEGTPVCGVRVQLFPADPKIKVPVGPDAIVEPDGSFVLSTYGTFDGAPEGEYVVVIGSADAPGESPKPLPVVVSDRYRKRETTDLKVQVKKDLGPVILELKP